MSIRVMSLVWDNFSRGGSEKLAMLALADWCDDEGKSLYPSIAKVSAKINTSEVQARRIMHKFIDEGYLSVVGNSAGGDPGKSRRYVLNVQMLKATPLTGDSRTPLASDTPLMSATPLTGDHRPLSPMNVTPLTHESLSVSEPSVNHQEKRSVSDQPSEVIGEAEKKASAGKPVESQTTESDSRVGALCKRLRVLGVDAAPHLLRHPDWVTLLGEHSDESIIGAAELAKARKPNQRLSIGYLVPMLREAAMPPARASPLGNQSKQAKRAAFFDALGVGVGAGHGRCDQAGRVVEGSAERVG